jgi:hypothetical protein
MSSLEEKAAVVEFGEADKDSGKFSSNVDAAWKFLDGHREAQVDSANIAAIRRKVDLHIVPLMFCCYTMQFLDKVILNVCIPTFWYPLKLNA